ncbi:MAG: DUF3343 domain-containing protein [Thermodesulfobacteriota bacterium]|nr:DUF3343 domain-containing protein [Thermodesulfobacteriota bacterium]
MVFKALKRRKKRALKKRNPDRGFLAFENTSEVIKAESIIRANGWKVNVMAPPPELRTGCDLVIEFPLVEQLNILRLLEGKSLSPLEVVPVDDPLLKPVDLFVTTDYGQHLMVRAANMKITVDKEALTIVNVSGGGCPDVPFLGAKLVGKDLRQAPSPREIGHTLCGYALHLAYEEMRRQCLSS